MLQPPADAIARLRENGLFLDSMEGIGVTVTFNTTIYITCNYGYILASGGQTMADFESNYSMICSDVGSLTNLDEQCIKSTCLNTDPNANSTYPQAEYSHGDSATVLCLEGFRAATLEAESVSCSLPESYLALCQMFELQSEVQCRSVTCDSAWLDGELGPNGTVVPADEVVLFGSDLAVQCDTGYRLQGTVATSSAVITCDCGFDYLELFCEPITCNASAVVSSPHLTLLCDPNDADGDLLLWQPPPNARVTSGTVAEVVEYGGTVSLECDEGYVLASAPQTADGFERAFSMECGDSGVLTNLDARCVLATCNNTDPYVVIQDPMDPVDYGVTANLTCGIGYRAYNTSQIPTCADPRSYDASCGYFAFESSISCVRIGCNTAELAQAFDAREPATPLIGFAEQISLQCLPGFGVGQSSTGFVTVTCGCPPTGNVSEICEPLPECDPEDTVHALPCSDCVMEFSCVSLGGRML